MGKAEYRLAKKIHGRAPSPGIERATVTAVDPLTIEVGGVVYSSKDWQMYEQAALWQQVTAKNGALSGTSVSCATGSASSISFAGGTAEEVTAVAKYNVGDLLAVQEVDGGTAFIILCRLKAVPAGHDMLCPSGLPQEVMRDA